MRAALIIIVLFNNNNDDNNNKNNHEHAYASQQKNKQKIVIRMQRPLKAECNTRLQEAVIRGTTTSQQSGG